MKTDDVPEKTSFNEIKNLRPLTAEEEKALFCMLRRGDMEAREILIERNMRTVFYLANQYAKSGYAVEDLVSVGCIGLVKAIDSFEPSKNFRVSTYASKCIENEIFMFFRKNKKNDTISLDSAFSSDNSEKEVFLKDLLSTDGDIVWKEVEKNTSSDDVLKVIETLNPLSMKVLSKRFGLYGEKVSTQKEVANELGVTQSYVSRIEKNAIKKIKEILKVR